MNISRLCCESMKNPIGISVRKPRLTWILVSNDRNVYQKRYRVTVTEENDRETVYYDTDWIESSDNYVVLPEMFNESGKRYYWSVAVIGNDGNKCFSDEEAWFEMGILHYGEWKAKWIEPHQKPVYYDKHTSSWDEPKQNHAIDEKKLYPCPILRKTIKVEKEICRARIYATAHGLYRLMINGKRIGDYELAPEATSYQKYLQVQTYDVTELLQKGENVLGAVLADGWWAGRLGYYGVSVQYGDKLGLLLQLKIEFSDGTEEILVTDSSFKSSFGARRYADLEIGEKYDMNYDQTGWDRPGFDDGSWTHVIECEYEINNLIGQNAPHMKMVDVIKDPEIYISPKGEKIIDFGQVMTGSATMQLKGEPRAVITLRYFEEPDKDGNYLLELDGRNSVMTDVFVLDESGAGCYDPWFTYHGFRYIYMDSDKGDVDTHDIKARLLASEAEVTLDIETSNKKLNRLQKNILWTLRSNMTSIFTDNPDRERGGWTGDLQMIAPTLCYNLDSEAFLRRWLREAATEQKASGEIPLVIPNWDVYANMENMSSSAGWGDVVEIVPWIMYQRYGDRRILEENYEMMKRWVAFQTERAQNANPEGYDNLTPERKERLRYIWNADWNFGDWLTPSACYNEETGEYTYYTQTLCYLMGTYYYAYSTSVMMHVAEVLGYEEDVLYYRELNKCIREAAIEEFYRTGKILESEYMGAQILALHMRLYPEGEERKLVNRILHLLEEKGMDVGFSSALQISNILCENGYQERAYDLLLNEKFPSWLYEVDQGATTVWESMQAIMPDGTRNAVSFVQPAYCSIGNWMVEGMGGISPLEPGFRRILVKPNFTDRLTYVRTTYNSVQGLIECRWEKNQGSVKMDVEIPANTRAEVFLPGADISGVRESGKQLTDLADVISVTNKISGVKVNIGSGRYLFEYCLKSV